MTKQLLSDDEISRTLYRYDRIVKNTIPTLQDVQEEDIKRYWRDGYIVIDQAFTKQEVSDGIDAIMDIMNGKVKGPEIQFVKPREQLNTDEERELACRKVLNYVHYDKRLHHLTYHPEMLKVIALICGETPVNIQNTALLKPPHGGGEKPWHQDMAYGPLAYSKPAVGMWAALDEASLDNGCLHIIPKSHMLGAIPHYSVRDWQICDINVPVEQDVAVPLKPGGLIIFHGLLYHGTPSNQSTMRRRAVQNHYVGQSAIKMTPKEYKRWFTNEMTGAEC